MKKIAMFAFITAFAAAAAFAQDKASAPAKPATASAAAGKHACADRPLHRKNKKCAGMTCPEKLKGVRTVSTKIPEGVELTLTAKDKETADKVQELALVHYGSKAEKCPGCPAMVPGAETKVENIEGGVKVTITGKTPDAVKKIQAASAREHAGPAAWPAAASKLSKRYVCPMDGYQSDKPGKCPKCGMELKEKK